MSVLHRTALGGALLVAAALCGVDLRAAPYRPASEQTVLERVVRRVGAPALSGTRAGDEAATLRDVRAWIEEARASGDPRALGRAEALLRARPAAREPSTERFVLQATIDQSLHRFDAALRTLDAALARAPGHAQARLTRASVLQVLGRLDAADDDCRALATHASRLVVATCLASVASLQGQGFAAYAPLDRELGLSRGVAPATVGWSHGVLAGIAERAGRVDLATRHYVAALAADPDDVFARAALADLLLDTGQARAALALVAHRRTNDNLLLREALALQALDDPRQADLVGALEQRFAAAHRRGESVHLREEARYRLQLRQEPASALELARRNWQVQREPADARILLESARAAGDDDALVAALRWYERAKLSPPRVTPAAAPGRGAGDAT